MVRLDDDELNINPEVAAALRYPRQGNARGRRNARADAQRRYAHDQGDGFGLFGAFGVALLLLLIICAVFGITGYVSQAKSTATTSSPPQTSVQPREWQSAAEEHPAAQPQAPPAIETTNPEIASQQTMQPPPQPESVPNSVEASTASDPSSVEPEKPEITVAETIQKEPVVISQPLNRNNRKRKSNCQRRCGTGKGGLRPLLFRTGDGFEHHAAVYAAPSGM